jgi:hypothetical protein
MRPGSWSRKMWATAEACYLQCIAVTGMGSPFIVAQDRGGEGVASTAFGFPRCPPGLGATLLRMLLVEEYWGRWCVGGADWALFWGWDC